MKNVATRSSRALFPPGHGWMVLLLSVMAWLWVASAAAGEELPLKPIDTSSPHATLRGFLEFTNKGFETGYGQVQAYLASSRLYLSPQELAVIQGSIRRLESAERTLDLSELPPAMVRESARRLAIQLKEILDRIEIPPIESVPDAAAMASAEFKRWTLPNSEIRIVRIESGARAGEYLFGAETVKRLPEFYDKVKALPYKPGGSPGLYDFAVYSPAGVALALYRLVPPRWLLDVPGWARVRVLDQPLWRWFAITVVLGMGFLIVRLCYRLSHRSRRAEGPAARWRGLPRPLSLAIVAPLTAVILDDVLRISGVIGKTLTLSLWTLFFLAATWLVWVTGTAIAESVIAFERLRTSSIDSQLIRLVLRLVTTALALAILIEGANRIGLPAYSVVAGLGVGGLAVALAGQQTLANLLGSLIIMFEKPFSIGDWIKVNDIDGVVDDVGFRSTRIRTFYDSLVTIPSSQLVNSTIDNLELREHREVKTVLNITYGTPVDKIEGFVAGIKQVLEADPDTRKDNLQVVLYEFGPHSLDILVKFLLKAPNRLAELAERQRIFLNILRLAEASGVEFAFPTQSLHIESLPAPGPGSGTASPVDGVPSSGP